MIYATVPFAFNFATQASFHQEITTSSKKSKDQANRVLHQQKCKLPDEVEIAALAHVLESTRGAQSSPHSGFV